MKVLGLIGGVSWVSTVEYYKLINQGINEQLGGLNSSECIIYSVNYADIKRNNDADDWDATFQLLLKGCLHLIAAGAKGIILCANTMHYIADRLEKEINVPVIHIGRVTANAIRQAGLRKVGLLGTKFTMELDFIKDKLIDQGLEVMIPDEEDRNFIHQTIFDELCKGMLVAETKKRYLAIIDKLVARGTEGVILGCTEIPLLVQQGDVTMPVFDTTLLHSQAAVAFSLAD
jgi:aspartate racemase